MTAAEKKVNKATANYRLATNSKKRCRICTMFVPPKECTAVAGVISPDGVCKYFERKKETQ